MNYIEACNFYQSISTLGSKLGLANMNNLLSKLDNPQNSLKIIHVAGTNGKGSVCTMINSILTKERYSVGLYTSPSIVSYNESIKINNALISNKDFADYTAIIRQKCNEITQEGLDHPTIFECLTALAFLFFSKKSVDFVILEVGLGGRLDATNVIANPLVSVITSISLDHTNFLGDSLDKIAYEKAGIIKPNRPIVLSPNEDIVVETIRQYNHTQKAKLYYYSYKDISIDVINETKDYISFNIETPMFSFNNIKLNLRGHHQLYNASTVLHTISVLKSQGILISDSSIYLGLANAAWECRMELFHKNRDILIDGSHNVESMQSLVHFIKKHYEDTDIVLIFGILEDKQYEKMMALIMPYVNMVILTRPLNNRALSLNVAKEKAIKYCENVIVYEDYEEALDYALHITKHNQLLCCAGSLYLVGHIRNSLVNKNTMLP